MSDYTAAATPFFNTIDHKELVDNALDICEEHQVAPAIVVDVSTSRGEIVVNR
jgi:DNA topoisomerase VI subunit B